MRSHTDSSHKKFNGADSFYAMTSRVLVRPSNNSIKSSPMKIFFLTKFAKRILAYACTN